MNRMERILNQAQLQNEKILVLYFPVGDSILGDDVQSATDYFCNGTTVLEIGLPYEDPVLDGEVVRKSMQRSQSRHSTEELFDIIGRVRAARPDNILQIMTYYDNIVQLGPEKFAQLCIRGGVDAVLAPDTPIEQRPVLDEILQRYGILNLRFAPFHLSPEDIEDFRHAKGYIFLQAVDGATGLQKSVSPQISVNLKLLRDAGIKIPIIPGFGIGTPEQAATLVSMEADGVVVGSAVLEHLEQGDGIHFIRSLRQALDC